MFQYLVPTCMAAILSSALTGPSAQGPGPERIPNTHGGLARRPDWGVRVVFESGEARVRRIDPGSAAARAGLLAGDVVRRVNQHQVASGEALRDALRSLRAGDSAVLAIERDHHAREVSFVLPAMP